MMRLFESYLRALLKLESVKTDFKMIEVKRKLFKISYENKEVEREITLV